MQPWEGAGVDDGQGRLVGHATWTTLSGSAAQSGRARTAQFCVEHGPAELVLVVPTHVAELDEKVAVPVRDHLSVHAAHETAFSVYLLPTPTHPNACLHSHRRCCARGRLVVHQQVDQRGLADACVHGTRVDSAPRRALNTAPESPATRIRTLPPAGSLLSMARGTTISMSSRNT